MEATAAARSDGGGLRSMEEDDHISGLPDDVLGEIISLLPTKAGARTQLLSRRWRPLWRRSAPLNLEYRDQFLDFSEDRTAAVVSSILSAHPGPARRASVSFICFIPDMDTWFRSPSLANLQELEFAYMMRCPGGGGTMYRLPPSALLRFAPTLRVALFRSCQFPDLAPPPPNFPRLKRLALYNVGISDDSLRTLISACTVLETLSLGRVAFHRLCICSQTLRSISVYAPKNTKLGIVTSRELVIEDTPCLERLLPFYPDSTTGPSTIQVIWAPKLKMLGLLSQGISTLDLGRTVFQKMIAVKLMTKMITVKTLALDSVGPNLDAVVDLLRCFPCLDKLYVLLHIQKGMNTVRRKYDSLDPVECLELHLKEVVLKNYSGKRRPHIDFARFFILNAKVLKELEIGFLNKQTDKWACYQRRRLQVENRASRDARIELKNNLPTKFTHNRHIHDLSMADPFESSFVNR